MLQQYQKTGVLLRTAPNLVWVEKISPALVQTAVNKRVNTTLPIRRFKPLKVHQNSENKSTGASESSEGKQFESSLGRAKVTRPISSLGILLFTFSYLFFSSLLYFPLSLLHVSMKAHEFRRTYRHPTIQQWMTMSHL